MRTPHEQTVPAFVSGETAAQRRSCRPCRTARSPENRYFCRVCMVPGEGIEPPTNGLQNRCSTAELARRPVNFQRLSSFENHWKYVLLPNCYPSCFYFVRKMDPAAS